MVFCGAEFYFFGSPRASLLDSIIYIIQYIIYIIPYHIIYDIQFIICSLWWLHGQYCPWNSPSKNTGVGSRSFLQGIFPTQGLNPGLHIAGGFFTIWATRKVAMKVKVIIFMHILKILIYLVSYFWLCWIFVAAPGFSLVVESKGYSLAGLPGLLIAMASCVGEHSFFGEQAQ